MCHVTKEGVNDLGPVMSHVKRNGIKKRRLITNLRQKHFTHILLRKDDKTDGHLSSMTLSPIVVGILT